MATISELVEMTYTVEMITGGVGIPVMILQAHSIEQASRVARSWGKAHSVTIKLLFSGAHIGTFVYQEG